MKKIHEIWKNKYEIANGIWNYFFGSRKAKEVAKKRLEICRSNVCGFYDKDGESSVAFFPGQESCGQCGCLLKTLCASQQATCSLINIGQAPLWEPQNK